MARVQAYARIQDDFKSQQRFAEIRLRACQRIGEISRDLEKAEFKPGVGACVLIDGKTKEQQLTEAGISTSTAARYEALARFGIEVGQQSIRSSRSKEPRK